MAILQDVEARLKREQEQAERRLQHKKTFQQQLAGGFLIGTIVSVGILLTAGAIILLPDTTLRNTNSSAYENRVITNLAELVRQGTEIVLPTQEAIEHIRGSLSAGDFALLTSPGVKSTRANTTITYDLRVVRSEGFTQDVIVSVDNLPEGITVDAKPKVVSGDSEQTSIEMTIPNTVSAGNYGFTIKAVADEKEKIADAALSVADFIVNNARVTEVKPMGVGNWWQASIVWDTDVPANTWVEYTTHAQFVANAQNYTNISASYNPTSVHAINLSYLEPDTVYHFRIKSIDENQNVAYGNDTLFVTKDLPE